MRILLITGSLNQGGAQYQLISLAKLLNDNREEVEVLALTDYNFFLPYIIENNIKYKCISNDGNDLIRLSRAVRMIVSSKPDLVISYLKSVSQIAILSRCLSFFRFKLIISERTSLIKKWHDLYYFNIALLSSKLIVNSTTKLTYINKRFPLLKNRTVFIPNIIDLDRFLKISCNHSMPDVRRLICVGRISPEKNLDNLIKAIAIISRKRYDISLFIYGEAKNRSYFTQISMLIEELELKDIVKYCGATENIESVYKCSDFLCHVSFYEGFSNVISEALACGLPIVASNIEDNRYLIEEGINGFLVDPYSPESIAEGIVKIFELSEDEKDIISKNNIDKAKRIFNPDSIFDSYKRLLDDLI
jgi:glycosyltransferase involved in cell wall biosynthesis